MVRNLDLPRPNSLKMSKALLLEQLLRLDSCAESRARILSIESDFRHRITSHVAALPRGTSQFAKFNTSPFVLMFYAKQKGYHFVSEIERDILPAKLFSSMETSAGRMVQAIVLPAYGWEDVQSTMHSATSVIDARRVTPGILELATLKSGPRCLNDEMSKDIADDIVAHAEQWANEAGVDHVKFTYAALYGTPRQSNKKDWHVLRNIVESVGTRFVIEHPRQQWHCSFRTRATRVDVSVRIGDAWWTHLGSENTLLELIIALIRACVSPTTDTRPTPEYTISDMMDIVSTASIPNGFNVSLLQHSQLEWLFFLARHFCDELMD